MPTYEYACQSCGRHIEVYQGFNDEPLSTCSVCGGPLRKVFHPAGILFKGSGFYKTDSRSGKKQGVASGAGADGSKSEGKTSGGSKEPSTSSSPASSSGSSSSGGSEGSGASSSGSSGSSGSAGSSGGGAREKSA